MARRARLGRGMTCSWCSLVFILFPSKLTPKGQKRRIGYQRKRKEATQIESQAETVEEINEDRESESASVKDAENVIREN